MENSKNEEKEQEKKKEKNRVITISGEPVSGKSTVIKGIISKLQEDGIPEENIHLISTGEIFRKYRNIIEGVINTVKTDDDLAAKELRQTQEFQRLMEYPNFEENITKIIANLKSNDNELEKFSITDFNQDEKFADIVDIIDEIVDGDIAKLGEELDGNYHPNEAWIIDSRLAFHNIPKSFSVRLTTNSNVAGKRLLNDSKRGEEDKYTSLEEAIKEREKRRISEIKRYSEKYGIDVSDETNFDLIIDTSYSTIKDIVDTILRCEINYEAEKYFPKRWTSPKTLLPLQSERATWGKLTPSSYDLFELAEEIERVGLYLSDPIDAIKVDGKLYIIEGHHRNFASVYANKTLVPYDIIAENDQSLKVYGNNTVRQRAEGITSTILYGHEDILERGLRKTNPEAKFSYKEIYPDIYEEIKERDAKKNQDNSDSDGR